MMNKISVCDNWVGAPDTLDDEKTVIKFISHFSAHGPQVKTCFTNGNCFWFSAILHTRFPRSIIVYDPIDNHFGCQIENQVYDITGLVTHAYSWEPFGIQDELELPRIVRDCIYF